MHGSQSAQPRPIGRSVNFITKEGSASTNILYVNSPIIDLRKHDNNVSDFVFAAFLSML